MPLLLCPNDNTPMQELDRHGVMIDICPQCRGVWLDRGELEKLLELVRGDRGTARPASEAPNYQDRDRDRGHDERDRKYDDDRRYDTRKKKKRFELFDFFD